MNGEYLSGGYYVARRSRRADYMSPELVPAQVLSASRCICDFFPDAWAIEWSSVSDEERSRAAAVFGIEPHELASVKAWATENFGKSFGWSSAFYSLEDATEARVKLLPREANVVVFGLGLHQADAEDFLKAAKPPAQSNGFAPTGETGIYECVNAGQRTAAGGEFAGFELVATEYGLLTCSWLCNGLEKECAENLGIRTNQNGLIATHAEGLRCAEFISSDEVGAEPGLWLPWQVTVYAP